MATKRVVFTFQCRFWTPKMPCNGSVVCGSYGHVIWIPPRQWARELLDICPLGVGSKDNRTVPLMGYYRVEDMLWLWRQRNLAARVANTNEIWLQGGTSNPVLQWPMVISQNSRHASTRSAIPQTPQCIRQNPTMPHLVTEMCTFLLKKLCIVGCIVGCVQCISPCNTPKWYNRKVEK